MPQPKAVTIRKLREAVAQANASGESQAEVTAMLVRIAKSLPGGVEALVGMYGEVVKENRTDLSSAIEKALLTPSTMEAAATLSTGPNLKKAAHDVRRDVLATPITKDGSPRESKLNTGVEKHAEEVARKASQKDFWKNSNTPNIKEQS